MATSRKKQMQISTKTVLALLIASTLLFSCKGPAGKDGAIGPAGAAGINGTNGKDGNANVVYSAWLTPVWISNGEGTTEYYLNQKSTANALLTKEAIDKGLVYVYWKGNALVYNEDKREYELIERISINSHSIYFKIPGRTTNDYYDFQYFRPYAEEMIGVNYLKLTGYVGRKGYPRENGIINYNNYTILPEFANGKGFGFYNELVKDIVKYRVVVVYGSIQGRNTPVDMTNYEAVKNYYHLKD